MVYEHATILVKLGNEALFEAAVKEASKQFRIAKGCRSLKLQRSIETPNSYLLVIGWDTVENHMVDFRESAGFQIWRELASPHFSEPPIVQHVNEILSCF